jgi:uncharacterized protein YndB with AHSA1/START domain
MSRSESAAAQSDREIVLTRVYDAPRELVFRMFTDPEHVRQWWGPNGFTTTTHTMDVRPGGVWRFVMHGPDGTDYPNLITYAEVARPERLAYQHGSDESEPAHFEVTVTFQEQDGKTTVTMRSIFPTAAARDHVVEKVGAIEGGKQTLARLADHLARAQTERPFVVTRTFDSPRQVVWKAWTEVERLKRWWGPKGFELVHCTNDLRPGGVFHYCMKGPGGVAMWGKWVYREIVEPQRLAFVASFSDEHGGTVRAPFSADWPLEVLSTLTFAEQGGRTTLRMEGVPLSASEAERRAFAAAHESMQKGWAGTLDQLAECLAKG